MTCSEDSVRPWSLAVSFISCFRPLTSLFNSVHDPAQEKRASLQLQPPLSNGVTGSQCSPVPSPCPSSPRWDPIPNPMAGRRLARRAHARLELMSGAGPGVVVNAWLHSSVVVLNMRRQSKRTVGAASATMERRTRNSWQLCVLLCRHDAAYNLRQRFIKSFQPCNDPTVVVAHRVWALKSQQLCTSSPDWCSWFQLLGFVHPSRFRRPRSTTQYVHAR